MAKDTLLTGPNILISDCLLGRPVRYDGRALTLEDPFVRQWQDSGLLLPCCPEVAGGLPVPRSPAEIQGGRAEDVLAGQAKVVNQEGQDLTQAFVLGARRALELARSKGARLALLAEYSPSCGSSMVYDGHFSGRRQSGQGVTTALLRANGISVFSQQQVQVVQNRLQGSNRGQ
jgi:uncharacterized protein YbbK (DUF523 family)